MMANASALELPRGSRWCVACWSAAAGLLLLPLVAMQFTREVNWTGRDFVVAGELIGAVGLALELAVRVTRSPFYRSGIGTAVAAGFLILWVNGAVGMIGSEDNPYNLLFAGVIGVALIGALVARFQAEGMAAAMLAAAISHACVAVAAVPTDPRGGILSAALALPWLLSAWLFRKAGREQG